MCGIAGIARPEPSGVSVDVLQRMASAIRHRGPDGHGVLPGDRVGLAHVRLSIIDLEGGAQPLGNEDGQVVVTFNGEIYNYVELRQELTAAGHRFSTRSDTEVLVHGWEHWGEAMLHRLNGQFAFAIYDRGREIVFLARDRFGVRPLHYAMRDGTLLFASEAKALFATGLVTAEPDLSALDEVFTLWAARAPRTPFKGIQQLEPGSYAIWRDGRLRTHRWYEPQYIEAESEAGGALTVLDELMHAGVDLRMRADVPVGGYLSGGLDSGITSTLAARSSPFPLHTFSIAFDDARYDESPFQRLVAEHVGSRHHVATITADDVAAVFPDVVWHAETPLVRSAPAPMYLLARLARENGIKVVLTGEGADELFLGYDIFRETAVRLFCLRQPESRLRPQLFDRLYPYLGPTTRGGDFWRRYFLDASGVSEPLFSHMPRFLLTARIKDFYSPEMRMALAGADPLAELRQVLPPAFMSWSPLNRAAYLETTTLLPSYLLSSQGDRMALAHGVEARYPFLDHRLFEFAASLPVGSRLRGLKEKEILRRWAADVVPPEVRTRPKQPYRAPDVPMFFGPRQPDYVEELLRPPAIRETGIFDPAAVAGLVRRCETGRATGVGENQAFIAILSTQLWFREFFGQGRAAVPLQPRFRNPMPRMAVG